MDDARAVMPSYSRADVAFERGDGVYLFADDGRRFLDCGAGVAVVSLGHNHPRLVAALNAQSGRVWHTSNLYRIPEQERLAARLVANSFADTVFFCNSGAEAVEACVKLARKHHSENGHPERYRLISFEGSFHGRTLATIAAGGSDAHRAGFGPPVEGFDRVAFGNMNEVRAAVTGETAGVMVEAVQGEGGIRPADSRFLRDLRTLCDEQGLLLMFDEVQTGMGRTGKLWAYEWSGIEPDVMASAKGLGGGFPIGACLATADAAKGITAGTHGSTFGGNPLATAVANAVLDVMLEDGFLEHVVSVGELMKTELEALAVRRPSVVAEARGTGMMWGLKCVVPNADLGAKAFDRGLLTVLAGDNVLRLLPPLIAEEAHIREAVSILDDSCGELVG